MGELHAKGFTQYKVGYLPYSLRRRLAGTPDDDVPYQGQIGHHAQ
jgi:hypothetical protein